MKLKQVQGYSPGAKPVAVERGRSTGMRGLGHGAGRLLRDKKITCSCACHRRGSGWMQHSFGGDP